MLQFHSHFTWGKLELILQPGKKVKLASNQSNKIKAIFFVFSMDHMSLGVQDLCHKLIINSPNDDKSPVLLSQHTALISPITGIFGYYDFALKWYPCFLSDVITIFVLTFFWTLIHFVYSLKKNHSDFSDLEEEPIFYS